MSDTFGGFNDMACPRCLKYLEECKCNEVHESVTDPSVKASHEITDDAFACPRPGECNVSEDAGGCEYCRMIWAANIIRTAYAQRDKAWAELVEE